MFPAQLFRCGDPRSTATCVWRHCNRITGESKFGNLGVHFKCYRKWERKRKIKNRKVGENGNERDKMLRIYMFVWKLQATTMYFIVSLR